MLKVVIADDEARVCRLIQMLADWDSLGMEVVGTAANGLEALILVQELQPDILITDIRMPGCHGLELIEQAKGRYPQLEIVIISGYANFEYAQWAIKYGVGDYLLKPIKKEELMGTLEKLGGRCRQRKQSDSEVEQLRQTSQEDVERLQSQLVLDLVEGRLEVPTTQGIWSKYRFQVQSGVLQVVFLKMDYRLTLFAKDSIAVIQEKAEKIFRSELNALCDGVVWAFRDCWGYCLLNYPTKRRELVRRHLRDGLNQMMAQRAMFGEIEFSLSVGPCVRAPEELPESCAKGYAAIAQRLIEGTGRLLERVPEPSELDKEQMLEQYRRSVTQGLQTSNQEEIHQAALQLEQSARQQPGVGGGELLDLVLSAVRVFLLRLETPNREGLLTEFARDCNQCSRAEELFDCLRAFQRQQLTLLKERYHDEAIRPIRIAKQYIQDHYSDPISLEEVSEITGFSASYFSAMFKKETGEGFAKYLTRVRMDRARELLQQTDLPVTEICVQVGYSDLKHFTQTFKKATSLNPGQYRKLYG